MQPRTLVNERGGRQQGENQRRKYNRVESNVTTCGIRKTR
jgi:hypothetical protein